MKSGHHRTSTTIGTFSYWFQGFLIFVAVGIYTTARNRKASAKVMAPSLEEIEQVLAPQGV